MVKVSHINVDEFNLISEITNKNNKHLKKCLELIGEKQARELLPNKSKITVSFQLQDTNADIANGIRRCIMDEMLVKSFDFNEYKDFTSSDPYILSDFIKKQVCLLPIDQEFDYEGVLIKLKKINNTDEIIDVLTDDFLISGTATQSDLRQIIGSNIILTRLRPGEEITIDNITICEGFAYKDAGKFSMISGIEYEILDVDPIVETRTGKTGKSSLLSNPKHFSIKYTTHRNVQHPLKIIINCCVTLINRLEIIHTEMLNIQDTDTIYISNLLILETTGNLHKIQIKGEYWTLINLISRYCYILTDSNIKFVTAGLIHPEKHIGVVSIIHPEFSTLIKKAIKKIISELEIIKIAF